MTSPQTPDSTRPPNKPGTGSPPSGPPPSGPKKYAGDPIAAALRATVAEIQAIVARLEAPAHSSFHRSGAGPVDVVSAAGGPVIPPVAPGKEPTPGSAVVAPTAACGSTGVVAGAGASLLLSWDLGRVGRRPASSAVAAADGSSEPSSGGLGAGVDLGRAGESRAEGSMVTAATVSADSEGRAGDVAPARFSLPNTRVPLSFVPGEHRMVGAVRIIPPGYDALPAPVTTARPISAEDLAAFQAQWPSGHP